ncbi:MAG: peptidase MA family metallohydrolase [Acidobacteriota bacterium]
MKERRLYMAIVLLAVFLLAPLIDAMADDRPRMKGEGVTVVHDAPLRHQAESLVRTYPRLKVMVEEKVGMKLLTTPTVFLVGDEDSFMRMGGTGPLVAAFALFPKGHIVMNMASITPDFILLDRTFRHELCHLVLHDHIRGARRLPRWLDEGTCEWVAEDEPNPITARLEAASNAYALYRRNVPLARLDSSFSGDMIWSYRQSESIVEYVASRYSRDALVRVLHRMADGASVETAFLKGLSRPLSDVEAEWRGALEERVRWILRTEALANSLGAYAESATERLLFLGRIVKAHRREAVFCVVFVLAVPVIAVLKNRKKCPWND